MNCVFDDVHCNTECNSMLLLYKITNYLTEGTTIVTILQPQTELTLCVIMSREF